MTEIEISDLRTSHCVACEGGVPPLDDATVERLLAEIPGWTREARAIVRTFQFRNYYETISFVNAIAWMAHRENHHPDLEVHFKTCRVLYTTHAINGISQNDIICALRVNSLLEG